MNKRAKNSMDYITELGKQQYNNVVNYNLGEFYDPMSGHIIIDKEDINADVLVKVNCFLFNNEEYCMGYEGDYMYISPREDM